ncbi:hypothetical protein HD806DRAFT_441623 [Xylariaceae sp. AK1471]|nr:hypothetical protein HD806DRAFT_441623 [Xylariaceae sp. AK1471]
MNEDTNYFVTPPEPGNTKDYRDNRVYNIGDVVTLSWVKSFSSGTLTLTRDNQPGDLTGGPSKNIIEGTTSDKYEWAVSYMGLDSRIQNVFYLSLGGDNEAFNSHYFNITGDEDGLPGSTSSSSFPTSTYMSSTSTPMTISTSSSSSSSIITSTSTLSSSTELPSATLATVANSVSAGEIAGIVVGGTLGTILVVGALGFLVWKMRMRKKTAAKHADESVSQYSHSHGFSTPSQPQQLVPIPFAELEGRQTPGGHRPHFWRHEMAS